MHHLPARGFAPLEHGCDRPVSDVEDIVQQEGRAFLGGQLFEQREKRDGEIVRDVERAVGRRRRHDRFGQPGADVRFALGFEAPQAIDGQPAGRGDEPRFRVFDTVALCLVPAEVRVLDDVFGVSARADHPVGDAKKAAAQRLERRYLSPRLGHTLFSDMKTDGWGFCDSVQPMSQEGHHHEATKDTKRSYSKKDIVIFVPS